MLIKIDKLVKENKKFNLDNIMAEYDSSNKVQSTAYLNLQ